MKVRVTRKRIRERFLLTYELWDARGQQTFCPEYYGVGRMTIVFDGRKVGSRWAVCYLENRAYFKKKGLKRRTALHELYHHLAYSKGVDEPYRIEEKEANNYAKKFNCNF